MFGKTLNKEEKAAWAKRDLYIDQWLIDLGNHCLVHYADRFADDYRRMPAAPIWDAPIRLARLIRKHGGIPSLIESAPLFDDEEEC